MDGRNPGTIAVVVFGLIAAVVLSATPLVSAAAIVINVATDGPVSVPDYAAVSGNTQASAPGQVVEVLGGTFGGGASLQNNGSESGTNMVNIGSLRTALDDGGVVSATGLGFGFGLNETGPSGRTP